MRYHVLATDYDGTIAHDGKVSASTLDALHRVVDSGRKLILVTGRELPQLKQVFEDLPLFHLVVAENGGLLYDPATDKEELIGPPANPKFVEALTKRGVPGLSVGHCVVATWSPYERVVLDVIREQGLELQVIFNKGAVMVLPSGVNKAFGMRRALDELGLSPHNVVGVGDAENDHAFLDLCEFSAATANALPALKSAVDWVLTKDHGDGVSELIDLLVEEDLRSKPARRAANRLLVGTSGEAEVCLPAFGGPVLICGPSGSGKSTLANRMVEVLTEHAYQFCLVDPEGDYESLPDAVVLGGPNSAPQIEEAVHALESSESNVVLCLTGVSIPDRPKFFLELLGPLLQLRAEVGRPQWLILDEAHHLLPADWQPATEILPFDWFNVLLITVTADLLPACILSRVENIAIVGEKADESLRVFAAEVERTAPKLSAKQLESGEVWLWNPTSDDAPTRFKAKRSSREHTRHRRKYVEGQLPPDRSFYFRGPKAALNLRAQNLILFCQLAEGVDDETWQYHLKRSDYSRWFRESIKDEDLADQADEIATQLDLTASESKSKVLAAIQRDYVITSSLRVTVPGAS